MIQLIILFFVSRVSSEIQSVQHSMYIARNSRSSFPPYETGYMYSKYNNDPGIYATYGSKIDSYSGTDMMDKHRYPSSKYSTYYVPSMEGDSVPMVMSKHSGPPVTETYVEPVTKMDIDFERRKSEARYDSKYIPAKIKSDLMYEKLKSYMHYSPPIEEPMDLSYMGNDYQIDYNDIRTSSMASNDMWPYYYPYDYEADYEIEKRKDKRYTTADTEGIIPVHENIEYDSPPITTPYYSGVTTNNPVSDHKPYFSYILHDYFDKNKHDDEDPLIFNGVPWGKEIYEQEPAVHYDSDFVQKKRQFDYDHIKPSKPHTHYINSNHIENDAKGINAEKASEKGYKNKHAFDKNEKKNDEKASQKVGYDKQQKGFKGFKDFADAFDKKFSIEDLKKDSEYALTKNQDKGENRKGFRRVYHKDEYQEDNEFFNNRNSSARAAEKGSSSAHNGGSKGSLTSHSTAALGDESNASSDSGGVERNKLENSHRGYDAAKGYDSDFNKYSDLAKTAAEGNSAHYDDYF